MSVELHPDLKEMTAIQDQMKFLDSLMQSFTRNLSHYLNDQLIKISVDYGSVSVKPMLAGLFCETIRKKLSGILDTKLNYSNAL